MGNVIKNRNNNRRIAPEGMIPINDYNKVLKNLEKNKKIIIKLNEELNKYKNPVFECCVCCDKDHTHQKHIRCNHQLCKECYSLITDKRCPLCRQSMIKRRRFKYSRYVHRYNINHQ